MNWEVSFGHQLMQVSEFMERNMKLKHLEFL